LYYFYSERHYEGKNIALLSLGTRCNASTTYTNNKCENMMNGDRSKLWKAWKYDRNKIITFNFKANYRIQRLDIRHPSNITKQCNTMKIQFSNEIILEVSYMQGLIILH